MQPRSNLYISWIGFQRRPLAMMEHFQYSLFFIPAVVHHMVAKVLISYPWQALHTLVLVLVRNPDVVWVQSPPSFLVHLVVLIRWLTGRPRKLIADLHNAAFSAVWWAFPFTRHVLNAVDVVVVHNAFVYDLALAHGIPRHRLRILEDRPPSIAGTGWISLPGVRPRFVMPCSFHADEPVREVIEAARTLPTIDFLITGHRQRAEKRGYLEDVPRNVTFTDFLSHEAYDAMVMSATGLLCLTTQEGIQLSSAVEAVGADKPMIVSDTAVLRSLFEGGYFVDNTASALRQACVTVVDDYDHYVEATRRMKRDPSRDRRWREQADAVLEIVRDEG